MNGAVIELLISSITKCFVIANEKYRDFCSSRMFQWNKKSEQALIFSNYFKKYVISAFGFVFIISNVSPVNGGMMFCFLQEEEEVKEG